MKNVYIYCEGPTEESFVNEILYPYFLIWKLQYIRLYVRQNVQHRKNIREA